MTVEQLAQLREIRRNEQAIRLGEVINVFFAPFTVACNLFGIAVAMLYFPVAGVLIAGSAAGSLNIAAYFLHGFVVRKIHDVKEYVKLMIIPSLAVSGAMFYLGYKLIIAIVQKNRQAQEQNKMEYQGLSSAWHNAEWVTKIAAGLGVSGRTARDFSSITTCAKSMKKLIMWLQAFIVALIWPESRFATEDFKHAYALYWGKKAYPSPEKGGVEIKAGSPKRLHTGKILFNGTLAQCVLPMHTWCEIIGDWRNRMLDEAEVAPLKKEYLDVRLSPKYILVHDTYLHFASDTSITLRCALSSVAKGGLYTYNIAGKTLVRTTLADFAYPDQGLTLADDVCETRYTAAGYSHIDSGGVIDPFVMKQRTAAGSPPLKGQDSAQVSTSAPSFVHGGTIPGSDKGKEVDDGSGVGTSGSTESPPDYATVNALSMSQVEDDVTLDGVAVPTPETRESDPPDEEEALIDLRAEQTVESAVAAADVFASEIPLVAPSKPEVKEGLAQEAVDAAKRFGHALADCCVRWCTADELEFAKELHREVNHVVHTVVSDLDDITDDEDVVQVEKFSDIRNEDGDLASIASELGKPMKRSQLLRLKRLGKFVAETRPWIIPIWYTSYVIIVPAKCVRVLLLLAAICLGFLFLAFAWSYVKKKSKIVNLRASTATYTTQAYRWVIGLKGYIPGFEKQGFELLYGVGETAKAFRNLDIDKWKHPYLSVGPAEGGAWVTYKNPGEIAGAFAQTLESRFPDKDLALQPIETKLEFVDRRGVKKTVPITLRATRVAITGTPAARDAAERRERERQAASSHWADDPVKPKRADTYAAGARNRDNYPLAKNAAKQRKFIKKASRDDSARMADAVARAQNQMFLPKYGDGSAVDDSAFLDVAEYLCGLKEVLEYRNKVTSRLSESESIMLNIAEESVRDALKAQFAGDNQKAVEYLNGGVPGKAVIPEGADHYVVTDNKAASWDTDHHTYTLEKVVQDGSSALQHAFVLQSREDEDVDILTAPSGPITFEMKPGKWNPRFCRQKRGAKSLWREKRCETPPNTPPPSPKIEIQDVEDDPVVDYDLTYISPKLTTDFERQMMEDDRNPCQAFHEWCQANRIPLPTYEKSHTFLGRAGDTSQMSFGCAARIAGYGGIKVLGKRSPEEAKYAVARRLHALMKIKLAKMQPPDTQVDLSNFTTTMLPNRVVVPPVVQHDWASSLIDPWKIPAGAQNNPVRIDTDELASDVASMSVSEPIPIQPLSPEDYAYQLMKEQSVPTDSESTARAWKLRAQFAEDKLAESQPVLARAQENEKRVMELTREVERLSKLLAEMHTLNDNLIKRWAAQFREQGFEKQMLFNTTEEDAMEHITLWLAMVRANTDGDPTEEQAEEFRDWIQRVSDVPPEFFYRFISNLARTDPTAFTPEQLRGFVLNILSLDWTPSQFEKQAASSCARERPWTDEDRERSRQKRDKAHVRNMLRFKPQTPNEKQMLMDMSVASSIIQLRKRLESENSGCLIKLRDEYGVNCVLFPEHYLENTSPLIALTAAGSPQVVTMTTTFPEIIRFKGHNRDLVVARSPRSFGHFPSFKYGHWPMLKDSRGNEIGLQQVVRVWVFGIHPHTQEPYSSNGNATLEGATCLFSIDNMVGCCGAVMILDEGERQGHKEVIALWHGGWPSDRLARFQILSQKTVTTIREASARWSDGTHVSDPPVKEDF